MSDSLADPVQPDEGQGDVGTTSDAPYAEYLNRIPEEVRGQVEPVFRDWDANTTRRFQESSEYRKSWEPYEQIGVNQHDPQAVEYGLQLVQAMQNPEVMQNWWNEYAQQHNIGQPEPQADPSVYGGGEYQDPALTQLLEQKLGPITQQLERFTEWQQQLEEAAQIAQAQSQIDSQLDELATKHGDEFDRDLVETFVGKYLEDDPQNAVNRAWSDVQTLVNQLEKRTLQKKADQPATPATGGPPDVTPEKVSSLKEASEIAMRTLRNERLA